MAGIVPPASLMPTAPTANAAPALFVKVPPQVLDVVRSARVMAPGVVGKTSVNVAPVRATELPFSSKTFKVVTPVTGRIGLVRNDLVIVGAASTVMSSVAALPLDAAAGPVTVKPPAGMVLTLRPTVVPVISAVTVQEPLAGMVPPESETVELVVALVPAQVPPGVDAVRPLGSVSVKAAPVMAVAVGLLKVTVSVEVPFSAMVAALNALLILGRATFKVALAATALGPMLELTAPAAMVLVYVPLVADCTFAVIVQLLPAASVVAPDRVNVPGLVAVALAVAVPPQVFVVVVLAFTRPNG